MPPFLPCLSGQVRTPASLWRHPFESPAITLGGIANALCLVDDFLDLGPILSPGPVADYFPVLNVKGFKDAAQNPPLGGGLGTFPTRKKVYPMFRGGSG